MTLDEAIKHCKEKAKELRTEAEQLRDIGEVISSPKQPYNEPVKDCLECANEHEQLAEWLEELKELRKLKEEQRPQGKWLHPYVTNIACECSNCNLQMPITDYFNFCPKCGADMKGGAE